MRGFENARARVARKAREGKAKLHQQRAAATVQQSESDSDESVSEPPSKSARVNCTGTGLSLLAMPQYLSFTWQLLTCVMHCFTTTADDMTVLHVGAMAEVCGLVNHWTHNGHTMEENIAPKYGYPSPLGPSTTLRQSPQG